MQWKQFTIHVTGRTRVEKQFNFKEVMEEGVSSISGNIYFATAPGGKGARHRQR